MEELNKEKFGALLSERRKENGLTQQELADAVAAVASPSGPPWGTCASAPGRFFSVRGMSRSGHLHPVRYIMPVVRRDRIAEGTALHDVLLFLPS